MINIIAILKLFELEDETPVYNYLKENNLIIDDDGYIKTSMEKMYEMWKLIIECS